MMTCALEDRANGRFSFRVLASDVSVNKAAR